MTLILNAVAPRWAMQASDRRLSVVDDRGRPTGLDPVDRNKAIFVAERITFAYTGHADIGGTDTAEWLQTRLGGCFSRGLDPAAAIEEIRIMATQYFASIDADPRDRAHHSPASAGRKVGFATARRSSPGCPTASTRRGIHFLRPPVSSALAAGCYGTASRSGRACASGRGGRAGTGAHGGSPLMAEIWIAARVDRA
jgi:hypothetical protein